jgi:4-amino-4-deoxy-L-arabinose transferase-like glycosyltransferase
LFDRRAGLLAALLLATYPPHIHFSRLALNNIADPLFGVLALALLAAGLRQRSRRALWLGGMALGLTAYFYEGGRLFYPLLTLLWLPALILAYRPPARLLARFGLAALLVAAPVYLTLAAIGDSPAYRLTESRIDSAFIAALLLAGPGDPVIESFVQNQLVPR